MMPYCDGDPPSHCSACQLHSQFVVGNRIVEDCLTSPSFKIGNATVRFRRSWRWRIMALMVICTLLIFLMTEAAFTDASPTGDESCVRDPRRDQASKSAEENEFSGHGPTASEYTKKIRHELVLRETEDSVDQSQFRTRGLRSMNKLQSVLKSNSMNPRNVAKPWSHRRRRLQRAGTGPISRKRRILVSSVCTNKDISIFQSPDGSSGIPRYAVQIMNNCMSDCPPSDIHVFCGWFASALLVNPNSFKRIAFNDCLVNGGKPLRHGETLRFTYANSFMYPLRFKSASFCK